MTWTCCGTARRSRPWDRLAAWHVPGPQRGPDDYAEPTAADVPAIYTDVDSGELMAAQLPQVLGMHDAGHGSQARSCAGEPPRRTDRRPLTGAASRLYCPRCLGWTQGIEVKIADVCLLN